MWSDTFFLFRFEEALQKALRMVDESCDGFDTDYIEISEDVSQHTTYDLQ